VRDLLADAAARIVRPLPEDPLARRDPEAVAIATRLFGAALDAWYAPEVEGFEHLPEGPCLVVGTHNGGNMAPDMFSLMVAFWQRVGPDYPSYGLAHDQVFAWPLVGRMIALLGGVPADPKNAETLLRRGSTVLVYPGGDVDAFKPYADRHRVTFGGRSGFIKLALRAGVPILPVVSTGAHETFRVLTDGRSVARALGLKKLFRVEVLPFILCLPWGVWVGPFEGHIPLPSKVHLKVLPPIRLGHGPEAAGDRELVKSLAEEVRLTMQAGLDELAAAPDKPHGPRARLRALFGG
jgi:1-acyl-sn-glycerol-3-phosphate acyltransferase